MEFSTQCTAERRAVRMRQMMDRLDVDAVALLRVRDGDAYAEARSKCLLCSQGRRCLRWLDRDNGGNTAPDFCPLFVLLNSCRSRAACHYFADSPIQWDCGCRVSAAGSAVKATV